jgi:hypothetical protein
MMISWWPKHVGVILSVLMCDIWINVLLQRSALVRPLDIVNFYGTSQYFYSSFADGITDTFWNSIFLVFLFGICSYLCTGYDLKTLFYSRAQVTMFYIILEL